MCIINNMLSTISITEISDYYWMPYTKNVPIRMLYGCIFIRAFSHHFSPFLVLNFYIVFYIFYYNYYCRMQASGERRRVLHRRPRFCIVAIH